MIDKIIRYCGLNGIAVSQEQAQLLNQYMTYMLEYNQHTNLTAITDPDQFIMKHFVDSLALLQEIGDIKAGTTLIDIGSGAGLPGMPLSIMLPELQVTMVEATNKKVTFINSAIEKLGLTNAKAIWGRAEELSGPSKPMREAYDISVGRAVASLPVMVEYCSPFTKVGGRMLAMKGPKTDMEPPYEKAAKALNLKQLTFKEIELKWDDPQQETICRQIYTFRKVEKLSSKYPRKTGKAVKEPIC